MWWWPPVPGGSAWLFLARSPQPPGTSGKGRLFLPERGWDLAAQLPSHDVFSRLRQNKSNTFSPHRPFHPSLRCKAVISEPAFCGAARGGSGCFPRCRDRRSEGQGRKWRVRCEGSGGASGQYSVRLPGMAGEDAFPFLRESLELADLSPPSPPKYLWHPVKEWEKVHSSMLQGGCAPTMAAIEQGWVWPHSSHTSA